MSSNRNFETDVVVCGVLPTSAMRRVEGVRNEARYVRLDELGGNLLRRLVELAGCSSEASSSLGFCLEGVPTTFGGRGASDCLFDGVRNVEEGVSRSKRPSTRPFFCGVGPIAFRCAIGVVSDGSTSCSGMATSSRGVCRCFDRLRGVSIEVGGGFLARCFLGDWFRRGASFFGREHAASPARSLLYSLYLFARES